MNDIDHYEADEESGGPGIGLLLLGCLVIWAWGTVVGGFFAWLIFKQ